MILCKFFRTSLLAAFGLSVFGQDCTVELRRPQIQSSRQEVWINGKRVAEQLSIASVDQAFLYKGEKYIPILTFMASGGWELDTYLVFQCETGKLVAKFAIKSIVHGWDKVQDWIKFQHFWKADFTRLVLIDLLDNRETPMTLDAEAGFFPAQELTPETAEDELPPPPAKQ